MHKSFLTTIGCLVITAASFAQQNQTPTPQWRPTYHFTPPANWTNDPNGLIFLNGEFNLYYQHNPFENKWGHMSWGHAISTDLVNWKNLPVAIPEVLAPNDTTWIFSGSAVLDKNNSSGFGANGNPPLVAIFTAHSPNRKKESQFIAYSTDNGLSYKQYPGNPVIDLNRKDFRDPNVFWHEATKQWIMTVSMVDDHQIRFYGSKNLKEWTKLSDFGPSGYIKHGWECPSLLPLVVDGNPANVKWVLFVSCFADRGPLMQYFVGDFDGTTFTSSNNGTVDYGDAFYAAIAWRDAPQNKKILLGWLVNGKQETFPWKGQMSIPRDLSLKTTDKGLVLIQQPSSILNEPISALAKGRLLEKSNVAVDGIIPLSTEGKFSGNSNWIDAEFDLGNAQNVGFVIAESKSTGKKITVGYYVQKQQLYIDCSNAEKENKKIANWMQFASLKPVKGTVKIKILLDKSSLEVFGNDGERVISTMVYPDKDATGISVFSTGKAFIKQLKVVDLNNGN